MGERVLRGLKSVIVEMDVVTTGFHFQIFFIFIPVSKCFLDLTTPRKSKSKSSLHGGILAADRCAC